LPAGKVSRPAVFSDADVVRFGWVNNTRLVFSVADPETGSGEDRCSAPGLNAVDGNTLRQWVARSPGAVVVEGWPLRPRRLALQPPAAARAPARGRALEAVPALVSPTTG
jgi:hypothetical protein